jgi:hypothetical protein
MSSVYELGLPSLAKNHAFLARKPRRSDTKGAGLRLLSMQLFQRRAMWPNKYPITKLMMISVRLHGNGTDFKERLDDVPSTN